MAVDRRQVPLWVALLLLTVVTAGTVTYVVYAHDTNAAGALIQTVVTVVATGAGAATWLWTRAQSAKRSLLPLARAADELAESLRQQWNRAAAERSLIHPAPIPVQWRWSHRQVTGPVTEAVGGVGGVRFASLSGMAPITAEELRSGELKDLFGVYGGLDSGRLVILGGPGAGKSGAAIRLLRDALAHRAAIGLAEARARIPVPVLLTLHGWDPHNERVVKWLAGQLARDYPLVRAREYGPDAAARLLDRGYLAVILDGLDEMPAPLRPVALRALDEQATFRLVVLTRSDEMVAAVGDGHLRGAAALELCPIAPGQAAAYLTNCQIEPLPPSWQRLIDDLRNRPASALAQALDTPLMLTLVRDTYHPDDAVDELTDASRFSNRETVEDHLLDRVLPAAYSRHPGQPAPLYSLEEAQRWLGNLAAHMNDEVTRDLAWWQIERWAPAWQRAFVTGLLVGVAVVCYPMFRIGLLVRLLHIPVDWNDVGRQFSSGGLGLGLVSGLGALVVSLLTKRSPQPLSPPLWSTTDTHMSLVVGFVTGLVVSLGHALLNGLDFWLSGGTDDDTRLNILLSPMVGLVAGLVASLESRYRGKLGGAPVVGLAIAGAAGSVLGPAHIFYPDKVEWWVWFLGKEFLYGLGIGLVSGLAVLVVSLLGERSPQQVSRLRWSWTDIRTSLMVGGVSGYAFVLVTTLLHGTTRGFVDWLLSGLLLGLGFMLVIGVVGAFMSGLGRPSTEAASPIDPRSSWHREREFGLVVGFGIGLVYGLVCAGQIYLENNRSLMPTDVHSTMLLVGIMQGLGFSVAFGLVYPKTWTARLASLQLWRQGDSPLRLLRFCEDARERQVLRTIGPVYQFRHARLQDRLANYARPFPSSDKLSSHEVGKAGSRQSDRR